MTKTAQKIAKKTIEKTSNANVMKTSIYNANVYNGLNHKQEKSFRRKQRNFMQKVADTIFLNSNGVRRTKAEINTFKSSPECKALIKEFNSNYKTVYLLNDFTIKSIYSGTDKTKIAELSEMLKFIQSCKTVRKTAKSSTTKTVQKETA